jgi:transcriptional regulator with XRE-family HTH domain
MRPDRTVYVQYTERMESSIGDTLRNRRLALGLSLRHVARAAHISPSYLVALEHGRNPTTGRPPVPSPRVLAALGGVLGISRSALLELVAPPARSPHTLLYLTGSRPGSPGEAARRLFGEAVDGWIEVGRPSAPEHRVAELEAVVADHQPAGGARRLGLIFGMGARPPRPDLASLIAAEATWESDVADVCRSVLGVEPVANVCVYREADILRGADGADPLASAVELVRTHPLVAVHDSRSGVATGPTAIERMLAGLAPAGTNAETWRQLARAAAIGLAGERP